MINRELIRIKTVQLLYSYLLVENPFNLESQPSAPTKEKRFAYALYLDLLYLLTKVADKIDVRSGRPLADTRFIRNIKADEKIKSLAVKYPGGTYPFANAEEDLVVKIKDSGLYKRFKASVGTNTPDEKVWKEIFELIVMADPIINHDITKRENYTLKGVDRMRGMMDVTFANFFASADNIPDALKVLQYSMYRTRELYFRLLALPLALTTLREREIDNAQYKLLKTTEDINPNLRFIENEYVAFLRSNEDVQQGICEFKIDWLSEDEGMVRSLLKVITQSNLYNEYLEFPVTDFKNDCEFWRNIYRNVIFLDEGFLEAMEDRSVFWNDDIDFIGTFILKSIKKLGSSTPEADTAFVLPMFKDNEDASFGAELFGDVIRRKDYYRGLILDSVDASQWEMERLAFMDIVILMTALAEIMNFPKIPLTVSFNEYIEIAKFYSTPKSGTFINGLLGKIVNTLQNEGLIHKTFTK